MKKFDLEKHYFGLITRGCESKPPKRTDIFLDFVSNGINLLNKNRKVSVKFEERQFIENLTAIMFL